MLRAGAGETYVAVAREEGADFEQCLASVLEAMDADATCDRAPCSFGGAWTTRGNRGCTR